MNRDTSSDLADLAEAAGILRAYGFHDEASSVSNASSRIAAIAKAISAPRQPEPEPAPGSPLSTSGQRLRASRKLNGLSAERLAELAATAMNRERPFAATAIRNHENGTNGIRPDVADAYAKVLGVTPQWLLYGT